MKKLLVLLVLFISVKAFAQPSTYMASRSALWTKHSWESEWKQDGETNDVSIPITLDKNSIFINAKKPLSIQLVAGSGKEFSGTSNDGLYFKGITYRAYNKANGERLTVDFVNYTTGDWSIIGVTYPDESPVLNLRYYILKD